MLRDKSLIPLSRQHQHALALCVRIGRASPMEESQAGMWQAELAQHFQAEIRVHFEAEERLVFPLARKFKDLNPLVEDLLSDHAWLRERFVLAEAQRMSAGEVSEFSRRLVEHIRKEERQLFERLQQVTTAEQLTEMDHNLQEALKEATQICVVPTNSAGKI